MSEQDLKFFKTADFQGEEIVMHKNQELCAASPGTLFLHRHVYNTLEHFGFMQ